MLDLRTSASLTGAGHPRGFTIDRPSGLGEYLVLRFLCPVELVIPTGEFRCEVGSCLVLTPDCPHWYRGDEVGLRNDWCHIHGRDVPSVLERAGVPLNRPFAAAADFLPVLLNEIRREQQRHEPCWQDVTSVLLQRLLLLLGRAAQGQTSKQRDLGERWERLREVRMQVHEHLALPWQVEGMARLARMSPSRFAISYRQCFGVSPIEDLIRARLARAQALLSNRQCTVQDAAESSGFASIHYFSRLFKRRFGYPPGQHKQRKSLKGKSRRRSSRSRRPAKG